MTKITRNAKASWDGDLNSGHGRVSTQSQALSGTPLTFTQRIDPNAPEANPEEMIAAAAASCFSMALSKTLQDESVIAKDITVSADVTLSVSEAGPKVSQLSLQVDADIPGFTEARLQDATKKTASGCPVYQLLAPGFESIEVSSTLK